MSLTLGGDTDAFGELVQRHKNAVFAAALAVLRDYHAAEDCAQDAFLDAYLSLRSLRERASVRGWLCGIARRKALNVFNRTRRYESLADYADTLPDNAAAPEARLLSQEARRGIRASFAALSEKNRSVAELYFLGGVNTPEIARRLGISLGTVTYRLSVARARLKGDLQEMHDETSPGFTKTVMEKVGKLKTYYNDHNNSLDGFADALRETEQLVQTLPEGNDKHAALATISTQKYFNVENTDEQYSRALEAVERAGDGEAMTFLLVGKYIDMANGGEKSETSLAFLSDVALPKVEAMKYPHGVGILKFWRGRVRLDLRDTDGAAADLEDAVRLINPEDVYNANAAAVLPALKLAAAHSADTPEKPFAGMSILGEGLQYKDGVLRFMSQPGFGDDGVLDVRTELSSLFYFASRFDNGIFFDLSMRVGETRAVDRTAEQYGVKSSLTLVSLSESVTVPAGTFTDVMLVRGTVNGSFMNYAFDAWYAPGAGLVCFAPQNNLRPGASTDERYELESYEIKGGEGYLPFAAGNVWRYVLPGLPDYVYQHNERRVVWTDGTAANFTAFSIYRLREGWRGAHLDADLRAKMVETAADNDRYDEAIDLMRDVVRENVSHESV
ncbi:MAG: sigma-70 family RNA polymerase sigma factor, partial [Oscillospiraceae bacterium]|nr:sigma-70 family RNA polymerase sigma factor [Oscillospiraceae bacterium]